jgi:hypothetical protein
MHPEIQLALKNIRNSIAAADADLVAHVRDYIDSYQVITEDHQRRRANDSERYMMNEAIGWLLADAAFLEKIGRYTDLRNHLSLIT